jgi:uncharacterized membrane protein YfcA
MDLRFTLIGLIIGFLIGLTGMGGGSLMTPVMILIMGVKPLVAVGTDIAYGAITRIFGGVAHWRQGTVHRKTAYLLAAGSVPSTILGVGLTAAIKSRYPDLVNVFLLRSVGVVLILVAVVMVAQPQLRRWAERRRTPEEVDFRDRMMQLGDRKPWILPIIGAIVGFMVGLTSVGSGTLIILSLVFLYPRWESKDLVGTDVFHASMLVSAAGIAQFAAGNVNVGMTASLLLGAIPGVLLGSRLVIGFPDTALRFGLATVLLVSGSQLI